MRFILPPLHITHPFTLPFLLKCALLSFSFSHVWCISISSLHSHPSMCHLSLSYFLRHLSYMCLPNHCFPTRGIAFLIPSSSCAPSSIKFGAQSSISLLHASSIPHTTPPSFHGCFISFLTSTHVTLHHLSVDISSPRVSTSSSHAHPFS
jgi:hypothetical protein